MDLLTKTKFALWAGKSAPAVSKALKQGRLELFQDTNKINTGSAKSQKFKGTIGNGQKNIIPAIISEATQPGEKSDSIEKAEEGVLNANQQKLVEEAEFKKQQRIEKQLKNAVLMGQQVKIESINTMIMTWFDQWLNTNKRRFNGSVEDFLRMAFQIFENEQGSKDPDFKPYDISRAEFKRKWGTMFEEWQHEGNKESMKRLLQIQKDQGEN